jgi:FixJ family two-component response regulator
LGRPHFRKCRGSSRCCSSYCSRRPLSQRLRPPPHPSAQHLLDVLPSESVPGCILLDVQIPGLGGPELQSRLNELGSTLPIIFLTSFFKPVERVIARHTAICSLKSALDVVRARYRSNNAARAASLRTCHSTNKQVADALGGTERTIKAHRHKVMEKMQVQSLAELVSLAERVGVLASAAGQTP